MAYVARYKHNGRNYLASPIKWQTAHDGKPGTDELWSWSPNIKQAHQFATRAEAKAMLKELRGGYPYKLSDFTFEPVP